MSELEKIACTPLPIDDADFNPEVEIPYGCRVEHVRAAMQDFNYFLGVVNNQLYDKALKRVELVLMPATFSSIVSEFMSSAIPRYCMTLTRNLYHNGHPDLIPTGMFPNNAIQYAGAGIEIKASRHLSGWQGHNPEEIWLMVFVFGCNSPADTTKPGAPMPFRFTMVFGAQLVKDDWRFSGRSATSRRTITASVSRTGLEKMMANWIYKRRP